MAAINTMQRKCRVVHRTPDGLGTFAVIDKGRVVTTDPQHYRQLREKAMNHPRFEDTIPTDLGGLTERTYNTPQSRRLGFWLCVTSAIAVVSAALIVILL